MDFEVITLNLKNWKNNLLNYCFYVAVSDVMNNNKFFLKEFYLKN